MTRSTSISVHQLQMSLIGLLINQLNMPVNAFSIANPFISPCLEPRTAFTWQLSPSHQQFCDFGYIWWFVFSSMQNDTIYSQWFANYSFMITERLQGKWTKDALFILLQEMTLYSPQHLDSASFKLDVVSASCVLTVKMCKLYESQNVYKAIS